MDKERSSEELFEVLKKHIERANEVCDNLNNNQSIHGVGKLIRKCQSERKFLLGLQKKTPDFLENHIRSGNLLHLEGIANAVIGLTSVTRVLESFTCDGLLHPVIVDVICNDGDRWVKVIARNPQALHLVWAGCSDSGEKSMVQHAKQLLSCAKQHPHNYKAPNIQLIFIQGITSPLKTALENLSVTCEGMEVAVSLEVEEKLQMLEDSSDSDDSLNSNEEPGFQELQLEESLDISRINLDITTLICLVTNISFGHYNYIFEDEIINQQVKQERESHLYPKLEQFLAGKDVYVCETALSSFKQILDIVGGSEEQNRAKELLSWVKIIPDDPSARSLSLKETCQVKPRATSIFGTGDTLKAVTMTANHGFVRAAKNQGVQFSVFLHESRALTEQKQRTASFEESA